MTPATTPATQRRHVTWNFEDENVLITGAARGQGRTHALRFAEAGANLALCDIGRPIPTVEYELGTREELERTADECRALGAKVLTQTCDVRDHDAVADFVAQSAATLGGIDVAVAQAGIASLAQVIDMDKDVWNDMLGTNLNGVFHTFKHAARVMVEQGTPGRLVATGSLNSFVAYPYNVHYTAAKHGIAGLCKGLAQELAPYRIRVNFVAPTAVRTPMATATLNSRTAPDGYAESLGALTGPFNLLDADGGLLEPEEISEAVMWLASDSSRYVTGTHVLVDAGFMTK
ncbi:SDR family oxidoreductase [Georgenia sp. AZ-5]|uniref:SDR family oxidoreductase n=1 Tax=Georgenia sp. AZ-5 TaxID=3367526 RepID=UPI0037550AD0